MKSVPTEVLSKELMEREGVISITVKEFEKIEVAGVVVSGPAVILINQD
ncbi:BC1881 family protein [Bacillus cereus]